MGSRPQERSVALRELHRIAEVGMIIPVEHRPDLIPSQVVVSLSLGLIVRIRPLRESCLDDRDRDTGGANRLDMEARVAHLVLQRLEVAGLGEPAFAYDQDAMLGIAVRPAPPDGSIVVPAPHLS